MTVKRRFLTALDGAVPDRLPVTTHHLQPYFLEKYMNGMNDGECFNELGLDPICWVNGKAPEDGQRKTDIDKGRLDGAVFSDEWFIEEKVLPNADYETKRFIIHTPSGTLTSVIQKNEFTSWQSEYLIKEQRDIDIIIKHAPFYRADAELIQSAAEACGEDALLRGHIPGFEIYGQPGCWQDLACLTGIEPLILATFDDPAWVHAALEFLHDRKLHYIESLKGLPYDLIELGGGDASTTVISPAIFNDFAAPYDAELIQAAAAAGQRIVYHTCGGMMPILEDIAAMKPTAMETFTPPEMGGDADLAEAKRRIGDRVCMIGGFDQGGLFQNSSPEETRTAVRSAFEAAGGGGGFILSPSDHFFDADPELIKVFADEAQACVY